jgi:hypothetical protein
MSVEAASPAPHHRREAAIGPRIAGPVFAAVMALVFLRLRVPDAFRTPQFIAEDGGLHFQQSYTDGLGAFLIPYAGYLHLAPRLVALLATPFGAVPAPALYVAAAVVLAVWSAATVATANIRYAWVLGATMFIVPHTGEDFANIANAHWLMAPALGLALATPTPRFKAARINQLSLVSVAAFTGPFSVFAAPLAGWRLWHDRSRFGMLLSLVVLVGGIVQALVAYSSLDLAGGAEAQPVPLALALVDRWLGELAHGAPRTHSLFQAFAVIVVVAAAASSLIVKERRETFALLYVFSSIALGATFLKFLHHPFWGHFYDPGGYDRYFYLSRLVVVWSVALLILDLRPRSILGIAAAIIIAANCSLWIKDPVPKLSWKNEARRIDKGEAVRVVINPLGNHKKPVWFVDIPARTTR